jgi:hypothetical protein
MEKEVGKDEISIAELVHGITGLIRYLFSKWWLILIVGVLFGSAGVLYAWYKKPIYIAELSFVTEGESKGGLGMYSGLAAQFGLDIGGGGGGAFVGDNLIELLKSRNLIEKTLLSKISDTSSQLVIDYYLEVNGMTKGWKANEKLRNVRFLENHVDNDRVTDSILKQAYKSIVEGSLDISKPDKKLETIVLKMQTGDEFFSKRFAELLMENATNFFVDIKSKKFKENVSILQRQTDSVRSTLYGNISSAATLTDLNVNPIRQIVRIGPQRSQLNMQANAELYAELVKNLELSKITLRKETPLVQIIDIPKLPLEKQKPGRLRTGILFAIAGSFLCTIYILLRKWYISTIRAPK